MITERKLNEIGCVQYISFLKLLETFLPPEDRDGPCPVEVFISASLVNEICGARFEKIVDLLVKDRVLKKFSPPGARGGTLENVSYYRLKSHSGHTGQDGDQKKHGDRDEFYDYKFVTQVSHHELGQYTQKVQGLWDNIARSTERRERKVHPRVSIIEQKINSANKEAYINLLFLIKIFLRESNKGGKGLLTIPKTQITEIAGLTFDQSINLLVSNAVIKPFVFKNTDDGESELTPVYHDSGYGVNKITRKHLTEDKYWDITMQCIMDLGELNTHIAEVSTGKPRRDMQGTQPKKSAMLVIKFKTGKLVLNKNTGDFEFNKVVGNLNPACPEYRFLIMIIENPEHQVTPEEFYGDTFIKNVNEKSKMRAITFVVRDLKQKLGILSTKKRRKENVDIFTSMRRHGYRLRPEA